MISVEHTVTPEKAEVPAKSAFKKHSGLMAKISACKKH
jgi:hypothetical protein